MDDRAVERFANEWIERWNASDLEGLLGHYRDEAVFDSPRAQALTGAARVAGKAALRAYWGAAIERATARHFALDRYIWDPARRELVILYMSTVNEVSTRACEVFRFDAVGLVDRAEALYGASEDVG